jgi:hypothetical protein
VPFRSSKPWLALALVALALTSSIAAPANYAEPGEQAESAYVTSWQLAATGVRGRVDARAVQPLVLSPGLHWVLLPEPPQRLRDCAGVTAGCARPDLHTLSGWCLAHSTSTSLS